ncbi:MAG: hypothetical protein ACJA0H_002205 [Francisellaceae bacterium]|jgi:hypothetical protein
MFKRSLLGSGMLCIAFITPVIASTVSKLIDPREVDIKSASDHIYDGVFCHNGENPRDNPPWDPCKLFPDDDIPDNEQDAKVYLDNAVERIKSINQQQLTIDTLDSMGFLGTGDSKTRNGAALELLMWQAGFKSPKNRKNSRYHYQDFYNGTYGSNFRYLILPFNYTTINGSGWLQCQPLRSAPTSSQITQARKILNSFSNISKQITRTYETKTADEETAEELYQRQLAFNTEYKDAVDNFDYDAYMAYAVSQLDQYISIQSGSISGSGSSSYINTGCLTLQSGKLTVY